MTDEFQNYVDDIRENNKLKLILVPIVIVFFALVLNFYSIILLMPFFIDNLGELFTLEGNVSILNEFFCLGLSIFFMMKVSRLSLRQLGFVKDKIFGSYLKGALFGILEVFFVFFIIFGLRGIEVYFLGNLKFFVFIRILLFFIFQGMFEEVLFRGYLMVMFSKVMGIKFSIIVSSFLFAVIHLLNPNIQILGLFNIFLVGIMFGLIYYYTGNLWIIGAMHTFWNFTLGYIVGSQISGMGTLKSILSSIPIDNKEFISGGAFGFEASIVTVVVQIAISLFVIYLIKKEKLKKADNL
ncbi:CPBP family intramembrane glutamic endopeptidase [Leptotrichia sp. oral taxon 223]|uniref:CPBP family intramembrane glutamic endopeptidase n=1 Tax=Leptotrichia sp. oral taxon 223 TaxID=712363 RepID=UPI0015BEE7DD|nr:type II CAAX endopeptidase family protein [Leptotrichia sp. oral taxon 223]NWO18024.1 CPBP family intramembrane metalloprotease [Leptotrichia sp. oral taxon 223]